MLQWKTKKLAKTYPTHLEESLTNQIVQLEKLLRKYDKNEREERKKRKILFIVLSTIRRELFMIAFAIAETVLPPNLFMYNK